jgi:hypothetical protein
MKPQYENRLLVMYAKEMCFHCSKVEVSRKDYWPVVNFPVPPENDSIGNLELVWRKMNVVNGTELPITLKCRSMSVGDIAIEPDGKAWICASVGWEPILLRD